MRVTVIVALSALALPAAAQQGGNTNTQGQQVAGQPQAPQQQPSSPPSSASGGGSQQVVVNPPPAQQPATQSPPPPPPPPSTTVVNPPASSAPASSVYVEQEPPNPTKTIALDALYGGIAGALVGTGIALMEQWNHWDRDLMVGTGVGLIGGAIVGGIQAYGSSKDRYSRVARDGLGTLARDPVRPAATVAYGGRF